MTADISTPPPAAIAYLEQPPAGWFVLAVLRERARTWDWVALMVDVDPDDRQKRPGRSGLLRIPGRHRTMAAAQDALADLMATRH